jgi:hypothetical protein
MEKSTIKTLCFISAVVVAGIFLAILYCKTWVFEYVILWFVLGVSSILN